MKNFKVVENATGHFLYEAVDPYYCYLFMDNHHLYGKATVKCIPT